MIWFKKLFYDKFEFTKDGKKFLYFKGKEIEIIPLDMGKLSMAGKGGVVG